MQVLTVLEWALAALAGLCLTLCALSTVDSAREVVARATKPEAPSCVLA
ncbi:hypothetical protein [Streptomyces coriariae]|nr:hypothetical protein [Streptomyces coriariae]